ncbi:hypothetical protein ABK905_11100 [Acerihabitans sp. KWT182]|uniref:Uncharacterized protein n=1 Tax=Acerihabitans sp. KWT182 TaxID=3157919 RepID=A0AAU7QE42_9GAMM
MYQNTICLRGHAEFIPEENENSPPRGMGVTGVSNVFVKLEVLGSDVKTNPIYLVKKADYNALSQLLRSAAINVCLNEENQNLLSVKSNIKDPIHKSTNIYDELLVQTDKDSASVIALLNERLAAGKYSHRDIFSCENHEELMIAFPSFSDKKIFPHLIELSYKINKGLHAMEPSKTIVFYQGPDSVDKFKTIDKLIFPRNLFNQQNTAYECLRHILAGADSAIRSLDGNARFLYALGLHRLLECIKHENFPTLTRERIDTVAQEFPYLINLGKSMVTLYPELQKSGDK